MKFLPFVVLPIVPALAVAATEMAPGGDALRFINNKTGTHPFTVTETRKRPNIFLISLDMVSPDHHHRSRPLRQAMQLPTIDSLLDHGVRFDNAFAIAPLCAPARAGLMTGRYTYITANGELAHDGHETSLRPTDVIFPEYLRAIGYLTKHCGKGHLGTQKFMDAFGENDNPWDRWAPPVFDDENYLAYLRRLGVKQQRYKRQITGLAPDRKTPGFTPCGGWIEQQDGRPFPVEAQYTYYLVERALEKVDAALADGGGTKPIYLQLDIFDPHNPFSIPRDSRSAKSSCARPSPRCCQVTRPASNATGVRTRPCRVSTVSTKRTGACIRASSSPNIGWPTRCKWRSSIVRCPGSSKA